MVLPQAMAWVQYWFRVLSLKFCGKSKKIAEIYLRYLPLFACMGPTGRGFWLRDGTGRVIAKKVGYRDGSGRVVRTFWRQKAHIWDINVRQIIINSRTPKIQTALAWVLDELERNQEKENHLNTIFKMMGTLVQVQLYTFSSRMALYWPQKWPKITVWG